MSNNVLSVELLSVLTRSREEAKRLNYIQVDSVCLLLALVRESEAARSVFRHVGLEDKALIESIEEFSRTLHKAEKGIEDIPSLSLGAHRLLRLAFLEARRAGVKQAGAEHLMLSMLRTEDNGIYPYMQHLGLDYHTVAGMLGLPDADGINAGLGTLDEEGEPIPPQSNKSVKGAQEQPESDTPIVDKFGTDLTRQAAEGVLDPVVGREQETLRLAQILCRRKKNNPIIIGRPGVGKSAIVEGLAQMVVAHRGPHALRNKRIVALDMAAVVAGTQFRGQLEERLHLLIKELREHNEIILFIDEIHTMIGAGSAAGTLDAANILKPALARGEVQCIGATTINEFRKTIEKDGALDRRFQKVMVEPCRTGETLTILRRLRDRYEEHHMVSYTDEALEACVRLTDRYLGDRVLPDKAIDAMDEAGSRVHLASISVPEEIVAKEREVAEMREKKIAAAKCQDYETAANLRDRAAELSDELEKMTRRWKEETEDHRGTVDVCAVAEVVSMMSGIPAGRMTVDENQRLRRLPVALKERVVAQDAAVDKLVRSITMSRIGLKGHNRPIGTFMFVGPTGVGKTYLVKCLAEQMFDGRDALIRIDMSEYGEKYSVSRLVGAPPGYVGYDEGGQLTEHVRRHPYSIVLLDEIEKAHSDVFNILLQVMDEGRMTDGNGVTVDFRNTIIVMTSNSGSRTLAEFGAGIGFESAQDSADKAESIIRKSLRRSFAPEFLNRLDDIILFAALDTDSAISVCGIELGGLRDRMEANINLQLSWNEEVVKTIVKKGFKKEYGARSLKRAIKEMVEDLICDLMMGENPPQGGIRLSIGEEEHINVEALDA